MHTTRSTRGFDYTIKIDSNNQNTNSVIDENDKLIGAASLRHYLTVEGLNTWGHIGYGVRPTERKKGYGTEMLRLMLIKCKEYGKQQL